MNTKTSTPPNQVKVLIPISGNQTLINAVAAVGYDIVANLSEGIAILAAETESIEHAMLVFKGGVRA